MAKRPVTEDLSRRERQVMEILHRHGESPVTEIMQELPDPPTYSAVRSVLRILGEKALIKHKEDGPRYIYYPAEPTEHARDDMLAHVVRTYFAGSPEQDSPERLGHQRDNDLRCSPDPSTLRLMPSADRARWSRSLRAAR